MKITERAKGSDRKNFFAMQRTKCKVQYNIEETVAIRVL